MPKRGPRIPASVPGFAAVAEAPLCYLERPERSRRHRRDAPDPRNWRVIDDWPDRVPVTELEVDVFEAWFGDTLDELFGPV